MQTLQECTCHLIHVRLSPAVIQLLHCLLDTFDGIAVSFLELSEEKLNILCDHPNVQLNVKVSAVFHNCPFYGTTITATAFSALGVGDAATREKSLRRGSNPGR